MGDHEACCTVDNDEDIVIGAVVVSGSNVVKTDEFS